MKTSTLSTIIGAPVKEAISEYCRRKGMKLQHFIEQALIEHLEDEVDLEAYETRRNEPTIPLSTVLRSRKKA